MSFEKDVQQDIIKLAGEAGAKAALKMLEEEKKRISKERCNRRLRNTKLLLRNYRMLKAHCDSAIFEANQIDISAVDILDLMDSTLTSDVYVESIKRSAQRTYIIMSHIKEMLRIYEIYCNTSDKIEDQRRYNSLYSLYISDEVLSVPEIAQQECIDNRTVYKDIDMAVEKLTALIFGIDGLHVTK